MSDAKAQRPTSVAPTTREPVGGSKWIDAYLGDVAEIISGQHVLASLVNEDGRGVPYLTGPSDFVGQRPHATKWTTSPSAVCEGGDLLITVKGSGCGSIAMADRQYAISRQLMAIRAKEIEPGFLRPLVPFLVSMNQLIPSGTIPQFTREELKALPTKIPPRHQQMRVAEMLSTWDEALERLSRQIEHKERLLESIRERLIHGAHRLGDRNAPWPMVALSEVTRQLTGRNGDRYGRDLVMGVTKAEGIVPMREHVVAENISRYLVLPPNGFAYNPMRINIGSIAMSEHEGDVIVSPDYVVFTCKEDRLHPRFLNHLRRTKAWADFMTIAGNGSVRVRIYYASLAEFEFHLPPLDEQRAIVEMLDDAEREITALEAERAALARQRDALATELLTGRLRVPQAEAAS
ncbi:restriction endonuclease subunit S [Altererythrobacter lauratis]|jgi:Restriction endonuclease S subunits|uniref:Restriction endonuclease subunit S n=1 Tax=Alteraurantiacibacter lauratis TaxID=2054627 RepID=A0ABV7EKI7_9SPHN